MTRDDFSQSVDRHLKPKLLSLGFVAIKLRGCMWPSTLFRRDRLWFGASWDWRDRHLEVDLGHLHWFKDVMPRVTVLGHYSNYTKAVDELDPSRNDYLDQVTMTIADTIDGAIALYNEQYDQLKLADLETGYVYVEAFKKHLGAEVKIDDLADYYA